jgi:hypothetical protein
MLKLFAGVLTLAALALLAAPPAYLITGQVQDEKGVPACGVRVCAFVEGFDPKKPNVRIPCALSDQRGQFTIDVGAPGKYTLYYYSDGNGYWTPYLPFFRSPSSPAPEVSLGESSATASVNVTMLPKNGLLVGKGVDASTGLPVDHLEFVLCHADAPEVCWRKNARSEEGEFRIPAAHVPFTIRVRAEGYEDWLGPEGGEREAAVSVAPETRRELDVRLKRSAGAEGSALSESEKQAGVNLLAPAQTAPAEGAVFDYYPRHTRLEWSPVEGAVSYSVEVDYCSGRRRGAGCADPQPLFTQMRVNPKTSGVGGTAYEFDFIGAQPGRWRVWAVDAQGREGFKSPWRLFVYLK